MSSLSLCAPVQIPAFLDWAAQQPAPNLHISAITEAELRLRSGDPISRPSPGRPS